MKTGTRALGVAESARDDDRSTLAAWESERADANGEKAARADRISRLLAMAGGRVGRDEAAAERERAENREALIEEWIDDKLEEKPRGL